MSDSNINRENPSIVQDSPDSILTVWPAPQLCSGEDFLSNEFDEIRYIMLDKSPHAIIAEAEQLFIDSGIITIADNFKTERIIQFDSVGNYLRHIGSKGKASGEYLAPGCITVSDSGDLWLADRGSRKILVYSSTGEFKREITGITAPLEMAVKDSIIIGSFPGYHTDMPFRLKWFDITGKERDSALPYTTLYNVAGRLQKTDDGDVVFAQTFNDTIYSVGNNRLTPRIKMNILDVRKTEDFIRQSTKLNQKEFQKRLLNSPEIVNHLEFVNCGTDWIIRWQSGFNCTLSVITDNGSSRRDYPIVKTNTYGNDGVVYIPEWFLGYHDGYLIGYIDPEGFDYLDNSIREKYLKRIRQNSVNTPADDEDILNYGNLILCLYKLK